MAPILGSPLEREQLDLARRLKGTLDMANPQYYNGGRPEQRWIVDHTLESAASSARATWGWDSSR